MSRPRRLAECRVSTVSTSKYRINPDFVVPEPTAATFFALISEAEYRAGGANAIFDEWRERGVKQARLTIVSDEYPRPPYPDGVWLEGWTDENARMLPFGEAEAPGKACWPPLTYPASADTHRNGGDAKQAPGDSLSGAVGSEADETPR